MKRLSIIILVIMCTLSAFGQSVGLVLSGGGAKGMAHIGVIRALEENEIPIDYITGTSIGAIIGSLYAMGYTPDEMEKLIGSEEFSKWYTGEKDMTYQFFFKQNSPKPSIFNAEISVRDSLTIIRPTAISVVNPSQMNLAFVDVYAAATAACKNNYDSLFVPFRSVASDVFNKTEIILRKGDLGEAVRVSMSFPFVFRPIKIDSIIAYDGGIYNNFPYDVMINEFHPDIIIGSVVVGKEPIPDEYDLVEQIRSMIIQKSDYNLPDSLGIKLSFDLSSVGLLDFHKLNEVETLGYNTTISMIDSIKSRISARRDTISLNAERKKFKSKMPEFIFKDIKVNGVSRLQADFIKSELQPDKDRIFGFEQFKMGYFRLLSDDIINEVIPKTEFNPIDSTYTIILDVDIDENPIIHIGGGLSSSTTSQIYGAASYKRMNEISVEYLLEGQIGRAYNNAQLLTRFDFAGKVPMAMSWQVAYNNINYFKSNYVFEDNVNPAINKELEYFSKIKMALPFRNNSKAEFSIGAAYHKDSYVQSNNIDLSRFRLDVSKHKIFGGSIKIGGTTLNKSQYPTAGRSETLIAQIYTEKESFLAGGTTNNNEKAYYQSWLQTSGTLEFYNKISTRFILGEYYRAFYSTRNFASNYYATIMQADKFEPTVNSQFIYDPSFRSNEYVAAGIKPIFPLNSYMHLRSEFYCYLPVRPIINDNGKPYLGDYFSKASFLGEISLVAQYGKVSANAFVTFSNSKWNTTTFGITIGLLMINERFIE
jgi:NTE family protein